MRVHAPEKIVVPFLLGRLFEAGHLDSLRVHGADHMPAGAILARAINALQHDQERVAAVGVERALQLRDALEMVLQLSRRLDVIGMGPVEAGVD